MNYHSGLRYQRGAGFTSLFSGLFKALRPLASMGFSAGKKFLESDIAKKIGSTALDVGKNALTNIATDLLEGVDLKESAQKQLNEAKSKISKVLKGGGGGRKRKHETKEQSTKCKKVVYSLID
jgi:exonuclease VII small subunit